MTYYEKQHSGAHPPSCPCFPQGIGFVQVLCVLPVIILIQLGPKLISSCDRWLCLAPHIFLGGIEFFFRNLKAMLLKNMILLSSSPFFSLSLSLKNLIIFILSCLFRQILYHLGHTPQPSL